MSFFDTKEEVIQIELTNYGRYLLSKGRLKFCYYEFYDDDILYDPLYAGFSEYQGQTQDRIKQTPRIKPQYSFTGVETRMKKNIELIRSGKEKNRFSNSFLPTAEKHYSLSPALGTSDIASDKLPAWNVNFIKGQLQTATRYITGSHQSMFVPRIQTKAITFETYPTKGSSGTNDISKKFEDGSYIFVQDDFILLEIKEDNVPVSIENFDIEVYRIDRDLNDNRENREVLTQLFFKKKKINVIDGILVEEQDEEIFEDTEVIGPSFVEHYFNVFVDREINTDTLCEILTEEQIKALNASGDFSFSSVNISHLVS